MGPAEKLRELGHEVRQFTEYHYRVDGVFDFWYPRGRWHDLVTGDRGQKPIAQMHFFVHERLAPDVRGFNRGAFIQNLIEIGWSKEEAIKEWNAKESKATSSTR
jgi:hypothetical protein